MVLHSLKEAEIQIMEELLDITLCMFVLVC